MKRPVVVLAEDDPTVRDLISAALSLLGRFRIGGVAADGLEGAMIAADVDPDVVLLDYFMPRWDGCRAAEFIRIHCPRAKIVALSKDDEAVPEWADSVVAKAHIDRIVPLMLGLVA